MFFNNFSSSLSAIRTILDRSIYDEYFYGNLKELGFKFKNNSCVIFRMPQNGGDVTLDYFASCDGKTPDLWVEIDENQLIEFATKNKPISNMKIYTSERGQVIHPTMERIIQRIFMPPKDNKYPIEDREELVYGGLFGFDSSSVLWKSEKSDLKVLKYNNAFGGLNLYISSGLSNPENGPSPISLKEGKTSGYGYELMVFAKPGEDVLGAEVASWAKYIEESKRHIIQGQYLEYAEGGIPNTNIAGFIVVNPLAFPGTMPVYDGYASFNMLLGVTAKELEVAKRKDIYEIASLLFNNNYINHSPIDRKSLV